MCDNGSLVVTIDEEQVMLHGRDGGNRGSSRVRCRIAQVTRDQIVDLAVEGCREEKTLTIFRCRVENLRDLVDETHVCHVVGFVDGRDHHVVENHRLLLE